MQKKVLMTVVQTREKHSHVLFDICRAHQNGLQSVQRERPKQLWLDMSYLFVHCVDDCSQVIVHELKYNIDIGIHLIDIENLNYSKKNPR